MDKCKNGDTMEETIKKRSFKPWKQVFKDESIERLDVDHTKLCSYGISFLDDALKSICKNELVVLGARSGQGKSDLGLHIADHNAKNGKKVAVFYLEGGAEEAIARMKWRDICDIYFAHHTDEGVDMDYVEWKTNKVTHPIFNKLEAEVYTEYEEKYRENLYFYNVGQGLTIEDFILSLYDFHSLETAFGDSFDPTKKKGYDLDLIIIDHLQYFSLTQSENEISEITRILREVKNITDNLKIPVILISHLRKMSKESGVPDMEDFYGSSNIPKISSTSIMLHPATDKQQLSANIFPTYMRVVKSRVGVKSTYAALIDYDLTKRRYSDKYELYPVNYFGEVAENPMNPTEKPRWAR